MASFFQNQATARLSWILKNPNGPAVDAILNAQNCEGGPVRVVRTGISELVQAEPGQGNTSDFTIQKSEYKTPTRLDVITTDVGEDSETEWIVQNGFHDDGLGTAWVIPVVSNRRIKA